jgi:ribonuclease HII
LIDGRRKFELRQRYVVDRRPLEASLEKILRADSRAGVRAILAMIEKRRFENRSEGQRLRKMLRFERFCGTRGTMRWRASMRPE